MRKHHTKAYKRDCNEWTLGIFLAEIYTQPNTLDFI